MTDLFWPGDQRAGDLFSDEALLAAMVAVEQVWLDALVGTGIAPASAAVNDLDGLVSRVHTEWLANESEGGGNPAMALVSLLRDGLRERHPDAARWLHRGLTSQDVVDTALMICASEAVARTRVELRRQVRLLADLAETHRATPMVARTLTQHAVPTTFGLKVAGWLTGVLDAYDAVAALVLPVQVGGAAGTLAATVELAGHLPDPVRTATGLALELATGLGLTPSTPWHTSRSTITRLGDASVGCTDAWGRIANDVLTLSRPEIGELAEGTGGGSSTMPHKANPVLSTLVRRAALTTPQLAATLHLAAAESADERSAGPWHAEWATLRTLLLRTVVAAEQTTELVGGLRVHADRMAETLAASAEDARAEQRSMADLAGSPAGGAYLGATDALLEAPLARAEGALANGHPGLPGVPRPHLEGTP
jgi:3-carboxy-cis,cis-muconate cycloisomerase